MSSLKLCFSLSELLYTLLWAIAKSLYCKAKEVMLIINADIFKLIPSGYNILVNNMHHSK